MTLNPFLCIVGMKMFDTRLILKNSIENIKKILKAAFSVDHLEVIDESAQHAHHAAVRDTAEALTHIHIRIQAAELSGLSRIAQHRAIYAALQPAIDSGLHAVQIEII